jgi:hypothetical protein
VSAYAESMRCLIELHRLIAAGRGDGVEADAVRERMEPLWHTLDDLEQARIRQLSSDLYTLSDPPPAPAVDAEAAWPIFEAVQRKDWDGVLRRLGETATLPAVERARLQAQAWTGIGEPEVGARFLEHAIRLDGTRFLARARRLEAAVDSGRPEDLRTVLALEAIELLLDGGDVLAAARRLAGLDRGPAVANLDALRLEVFGRLDIEEAASPALHQDSGLVLGWLRRIRRAA